MWVTLISRTRTYTYSHMNIRTGLPLDFIEGEKANSEAHRLARELRAHSSPVCTQALLGADAAQRVQYPRVFHVGSQFSLRLPQGDNPCQREAERLCNGGAGNCDAERLPSFQAGAWAPSFFPLGRLCHVEAAHLPLFVQALDAGCSSSIRLQLHKI